jgi:D-alanyl-D-alanine carboxypeptidase (penicillin-binding protein 5/6)
VWLGAQDKGAAGRCARRADHKPHRSGRRSPRLVARFDGPLPAPIAKGAKLGVAALTLPTAG